MFRVLFLALFCVAVLGHADHDHHRVEGVTVEIARCGTAPLSEEVKDQVDAKIAPFFAKHGLNLKNLRGNELMAFVEEKKKQDMVKIKTYFHIISNSTGGGDITDETVHEQIDVLNTGFNRYGFKFNLASVNRVVNDNWYHMVPGKDKELSMKRALRQGTAADLNIYTGESSGLLGFAYYPGVVNWNLELDGVWINHQTVPGGPLGTDYSIGHTLTHETGHWLHLYHTFSETGECTKNANYGDRVTDTPAENSPARGCPIGRDTCTGKKFEGVDPIHNYMDYTYDSCYEEFTAGQAVRMHAAWESYRAGP
ncbi:zinc metalloprotease [archaeon]|nr:MAG: zinc metalloprotease [archaeon]